LAMDLNQIKREVDLRKYAMSHYGYQSDSKGQERCLLHSPDNHNSFSIRKGDDGVWRFHCFHGGFQGRRDREEKPHVG